MREGLKLLVTAVQEFIGARRGAGLDVAVVDDKRQRGLVQLRDHVREIVGLLRGVVGNVPDEAKLKAELRVRIVATGIGRVGHGSREDEEGRGGEEAGESWREHE